MPKSCLTSGERLADRAATADDALRLTVAARMMRDRRTQKDIAQCMLIEIATKEPGENVQTRLVGTYVKVTILLALKYDDDQEIEALSNMVMQSITFGIDTVYILALGRRINSAKEIACKVSDADKRIIKTPIITKYKKTSSGGRITDGICIELTCIDDVMADEQ